MSLEWSTYLHRSMTLLFMSLTCPAGKTCIAGVCNTCKHSARSLKASMGYHYAFKECLKVLEIVLVSGGPLYLDYSVLRHAEVSIENV